MEPRGRHFGRWGVALGALQVALLACTDIGDPALMDEVRAPSGALSFEHHIRPILLEHGCLGCHPAGGGQGGLDLSSPEAMKRGGASGQPAVVECEHARSWLWHRVRRCEMPATGYPDCLDGLAVATIARWIDQGARATFEPGACPDAPLD